MFESKYSKVLTIILVIVIVAIVILLGFLAYDYIHKFNSTKQASDFVEDYQGDITTSEENKTEENIQENVTLDATNETPITNSTTTNTTNSTGKKKYKGFTVVGTMRIPAINLEYPIFEEITTKALETGLVVYYPSGDNINQVGNTVIAGHNYRNGMFFSNLKKLSNGAKIYIKDFRGTTLTYEVYNKFEASSTDTSFYSRDTNGVAEITLSTCTDASNDQRTILFAKQI